MEDWMVIYRKDGQYSCCECGCYSDLVYVPYYGCWDIQEEGEYVNNVILQYCPDCMKKL